MPLRNTRNGKNRVVIVQAKSGTSSDSKIEGICLSAVVDGNKIEAGYSDDSYSYIAFNGHWIAEKKRWI